MRTKCFIPLLTLSLLISACDDELNLVTEMEAAGITVVEGYIQSPQWLVDAIDEVGERYAVSPATGKRHLPWVYLVRHKGETYIELVDGLNAAWTLNNMFYTTSGIRVWPEEDPLSGLYYDLLKEENKTLIWEQDY